MKRWVCPTCNGGVLGPERPRKDDVRRYCLPCSQKSGRLVERVCPALERERQQAVERQKGRRKRRQATARGAQERRAAFEAERRHVLGIDLQALMRRWWRLKRFRQQPVWRSRCPELSIRLGTRHKEYVAARAYGKRRITMTIPTLWTKTPPTAARLAQLQVILLHELTHLVTAWHVKTHGHEYNANFIAAARSIWGDEVAGIADTGMGYRPTRLIQKRLTEKLAERAGEDDADTTDDNSESRC